MWRTWIGWGLLILGPTAVWGTDTHHQVKLSITIATGSSDKLNPAAEPEALIAAIAELERANELTSMTRLNFTTLDEVESRLQFGASQAVVTGRNFTGGFGRSQPPGAGGGPISMPVYSREETGTMLTAMTHVTEAGVVADLAIEQSQFDRSKPAANDDNAVTPPEKSVLTLKTTISIPKSGAVVVGGFESKTGDASQRTVVLASAQVGEPLPVGNAEIPVRSLRVFALKALAVKETLNLLENVFDESGMKFAAEAATNSLVAQGTDEQLTVVEALLSRLDQ